MKLNRKTSNLDERQERRLLEIEGKGFRIAFWGLLFVFLIEMTVTDDLSAFIGDFILLIVVSLYVGIACIREGIWGRGQSVHRRSCLCWSLLAALAATGLRLGSVWMRYHSLQFRSIAVSVFFGGITFILSYIGLSLVVRATKRRQDMLNVEPKEEEIE